MPLPCLVSFRAPDQQPPRPIAQEIKILDVDRDQLAAAGHGVIRHAQHGPLAQRREIVTGRAEKHLDFRHPEASRLTLARRHLVGHTFHFHLYRLGRAGIEQLGGAMKTRYR